MEISRPFAPAACTARCRSSSMSFCGTNAKAGQTNINKKQKQRILVNFSISKNSMAHARVTTAESPNGTRGRNFAATPPPRVGRHRNQPIITSVGQCDAWGGAGRSSICQVGFCGAGWHIFSVYWSAGGSYFLKKLLKFASKQNKKHST